jgi:uncharacterized protein (TIGR02001 family)
MKLSIGVMALAAVLVSPLVGAAQEAEVSANVGWVSEYYYRGIYQQKVSSGSAGLDVAVGNVYLGTWAADVGDGNEVDLYAGLGTETSGGFSVSAGGTGYFYTGGFDDTYLEGNLNVGYQALSGEFSYGTYDTSPTSQAYWFLGITLEGAGLYTTFGTFGKDFSGEYFEAGYGTSVSGLDLSVSWIYNDAELSGAKDDHNLVFGISHTFDIN